jgi:hypothetical protein
MNKTQKAKLNSLFQSIADYYVGTVHRLEDHGDRMVLEFYDNENMRQGGVEMEVVNTDVGVLVAIYDGPKDKLPVYVSDFASAMIAIALR